MTHVRDRAWLALALSVVAVLWGALELFRPLPFGTGGDSMYYYVPHVFRVHDVLLRLGRPRIEWALGQGWNPLESGQMGIGYPTYVLSTVIARVLHRPELTIDLSALFTALLVVGVVFAFGARLPASTRAAVAVAVCTQPAALLYGIGSHNFFTTVPWVAGLGLVLVGAMQHEGGFVPARHLLALGLLDVGFFWTSHPQMFVVLNVLAALLAVGLAESWTDARRAVGTLFAASLVVCVPLAYYFWLSTIVKGVTSHDHDAYALFKTSVPFLDMLKWTVVGGLQGGDVWHRGWLFFSPCFAVVVVVALCTRRARPVQTALATLILLAPAVLPESLWFDPLVLRMRWPEKATTITGALAIVVVAAVIGRAHPRRTAIALAVTSVLGVGAFVAGLSTEPIPNAREVGVGKVAAETGRCLDQLGVPRGARIAWVGGVPSFPMRERYPLPLLGLIGGGPLLTGRGSAMLYEPLEPDVVYQGHARLDVPWRNTVPPGKIAERDPAMLTLLRDLGVSWLVALGPGALSSLGSPRACFDVQGRATYAVALPGEPVVAFPWATVDGTRLALTVLPDGSLETPRRSASRPETNLARSVTWTRLSDGRWHGQAPIIAWEWVAGTILTMTAWLVAVLRYRRTRFTGDAGPRGDARSR